MNEILLQALPVYLAVFLLVATFGIGMLDGRSAKERKFGARMALLSPVWPFALVWLLLLGCALGVRSLWRTADWTNKA